MNATGKILLDIGLLILVSLFIRTIYVSVRNRFKR